MTNRFTIVDCLRPRAVLMALTPPADAAAKQANPAHPTETTAPRDAGEPIMAIVSIKSQQVTIYDADGWIFRAPVSTGIKGRETPAGIFSVVEKDKDHHSNLYDDAWMPNMERITWSGIALHGGPLPGYAASHGCIRMPYDFAEKLFGKTQIGMRVIIAPNDAEPVAFSDPKLFVPNADALAAAPARAETLAREAADAAKAADEAKTAAAVAAREAAAAPAAVRKLEMLKTRADAELAFAEKVLAAAKTDQDKARTEDARQKVAAKAADLGTQLDAAKADAQGEARRGRGGADRRSRRPRPSEPKRPPRRATQNSRSSRSRSSSAARPRSSMCGAASRPPSKSRSRSAIPTSRSAPISSPRWRAPTAACAGPRSPSTTATTPRTRSTASPSRKTCSTASRRPPRRDPRSSSPTSRRTASRTIAPSSSSCSTTSPRAASPSASPRADIVARDGYGYYGYGYARQYGGPYGGTSYYYPRW